MKKNLSISILTLASGLAFSQVKPFNPESVFPEVTRSSNPKLSKASGMDLHFSGNLNFPK